MGAGPIPGAPIPISQCSAGASAHGAALEMRPHKPRRRALKRNALATIDSLQLRGLSRESAFDLGVDLSMPRYTSQADHTGEFCNPEASKS